MLVEGEVFAGKLLNKNARKITPKTASVLVEKTKSDEERRFYTFLGDMNSSHKED